MKRADKERYIKILEEGNEKRYYIKIMILGRHGVGKTSLMRRLLRDTTEGVTPTDGIDIVKKYKVDIKSGEWIFCEGENIEERIGRAIRQKDDSDKMDQSKKVSAQNKQSETLLTGATVSNIQMEGGETIKGTMDQDFRKKIHANSMKTSPMQTVSFEENILSNQQHQDISAHHMPYNEVIGGTNKKGKLNIKNEHHHGGTSEVSRTAYDNKPTEKIATVPKSSENIETLLEIGCKAKVSGNEYADCIIMDFAGHKEYYSTHQTFITKNAIYLVVFSLKDDHTFTETVEETEQLSFWIDNIHCYAQQGQKDRPDTKDGGLSPPIIMVCTGLDTVDSKIPYEKWRRLLDTNQRRCHLRGGINYLSNTEKSEESFHALRTKIFEVAKDAKDAKDMSFFGHDYPVRWVKLERALETLRNKDKNVIMFTDIIGEAKKEPVPIKSVDEVILFLKFQHEIGNVIFYDDEVLKDYVVIKPIWLINAFKCIISADDFQQESIRTHPDEIKNFKKQGIISFNVCQTLFQEKSDEHAKHAELVLQIMEKFDIIVKDPLKIDSYICPSAIKKDSSGFEEIDRQMKDNWSRSPWLCFEFEFLPPALYNHLLVLCMRDDAFEKPKLFPEIGIFCIKGSNRQEQFFLCKSRKTILIQKNQFHSKLECDDSSGKKTKNTLNGQDLFHKISSQIKSIQKKYQITLNFHTSIQCGDAPYTFTGDGYTEEMITKNSTGMCFYHKPECTHEFRELFKFWFDRNV